MKKTTRQLITLIPILAVGALASMMVFAQQDPPTEDRFPTTAPMGSEDFGHSVTDLGDGLYVFRWWVYRNIFIVTDEGVIVTDPMNPKAAGLLREEIRKITDQPVKFVVYSHNHHDHISGGNLFKKEGAKFVAHKNVVKQLQDHPSLAIPMPDITFEKTHVVELGGRSLELHYFGPNHGDGCRTKKLRTAN